jgi:hypothetical protein
MSSNSIRLPSFDGRTFEASELIPVDIVEETRQMDSLNGNKATQHAEPVSGRLSQEQIMMLCDEFRNPELSAETREAIKEVLSLYGFQCSQSSDSMTIAEEEVDVDDTLSLSRHLAIEEIMDRQIAQERTSKHISKL